MENDSPVPELHIDRRIFSTRSLNLESNYNSPPNRSLKGTIKEKCYNFNCLSFLWSSVPILQWLPEYQWKKHFCKDIISGLTVAVMHIPQGMGYALLGNVPPIMGIYMAFFPVLVYVIFGTSRHVSMGTFAVICLMTGKVVQEHSSFRILQNGTKITIPDANPNASPYTNIEVAYTLTFTVALIQLVMYILRLGVISTLLSDTLVGGFTCGSAFHVVASQLRDLLGLPINKRRGFFAFVLTVYDSVLAIPKANVTCVIVSVITLSILVLNEKLIKPKLKKMTTIPVPIELLVVSFGTLASYLMNLKDVYNVSIIGNIPTGLPAPALPKFDLIPDVLLDAFVITMVSYSITVSMGLIFARMLHYEIDFNQELLAMSLSNFFGSFFSTMPVTASLSRSMIQQAVGGVTQLASVVSCCILLFVLLWIGPVFENLPRCILASIIIVALSSMVMKVKQLKKYWKLSKWDALVWIVTFSVTVFIQISLGLAAGIVMAIYSLFMQNHNPNSCILGRAANTDIYLDIYRHKNAQEIDGIKIFRFTGAISFVSKSIFRKTLNKKIGFDPAAMMRRKIKIEDKGQSYSEESLNVRCVILDFSPVTFVDPTGVNTLNLLQKDFRDVGVDMYIANCSDPVFEMFVRCDTESENKVQFTIFPTIHDAVLFAQHNIFNKMT